MKLIADEGVDKPIVEALRLSGFDVRIFWKQIRELEMNLF